MPKSKLLVKDVLKKLNKEIISIKNKFKGTKEVFSKMERISLELEQVKAHAKISKDYNREVDLEVNKSSILNAVVEFNKQIDVFSKEFEDLKVQAKDMHKFLEKFRTTREYHVRDTKKLFRFLSGFLEGFSEYFRFKPEFIGVVSLNDIAKNTGGVNEGTTIKISYEKLPKIINYAYQKRMNNFTIDSHNLKMVFYKDYKIKIDAETQMIKKIDRVANESDVEF